jgi:hypothetical protein
MENPRTTSPRDHDDSALIDTAEPGTSQAGRTGGVLAADVATEAELAAIDDPESRRGVTKAKDIEHDTEQRPDRPRAMNAGAEPDAPGDLGSATVGD